MRSYRLLLPTLLLAASPLLKTAAPRETPHVTGAFFALSVADLQASTNWYRETFDLKLIMSVPPGNGPAVSILSGDGLTVELIQHPAATARPESIRKEPVLQHGFTKAGFFVSNFDQTVADLRARKVDIAYGPFPANGSNPPNLIVRDNAGNLLQLFGR